MYYSCFRKYLKPFPFCTIYCFVNVLQSPNNLDTIDGAKYKGVLQENCTKSG